MVRTIKNAKEFAAAIAHKNEAQKELLDIYENCFLPVLKEFDGKVYNKRFRTAVEIRMQQTGHNGKIYLREKSQHHEQIELQLQEYTCPGNYNEYEDLYICLIAKYVAGNYRISYIDTIQNNIHEAWIKNGRKNITERQQAVDEWQKCMQVANELERALKAYNALPFAFRMNVDRNQFHVY